MTYDKPHIVFIPGDVSIDAVDALRRALANIKRPIKLNTFSPKVRRALTTASSPIKRARARIRPSIYESKEDKKKRIKQELLDAGVTFYGLLKSETRFLPKILHPDEHVKAVVYGLHHSNSVMLVATNTRIIYLDKKPIALFLDEVSYEVISGLEFEIHTFFATLVLHTPVKNYDIRHANLRCAENFARHIETERLKIETKETKKPVFEEQKSAPERFVPDPEYHGEPKGDMAGYYLLPMDEEERVRIQSGAA